MPISTCTIKETDIVWTDISEPTHEELERISDKYSLNTYTLTDSLDPDHLPKYEEHNDTHFIIVRMLQEGEHATDHTVQEVSSKIAIFYNHDFIVTIHRRAEALLKEVREVHIDTGKVRSTTGIVIRIIRETLHTYDRPAIQLSSEIDFFESRLFLKKNFPADLIKAIYFLKSRAGTYKKLLLLSNEVVSSVRAEGEDRPAMRDAHDLHTKLLMLYDQVQDDANNLLNIYLSLSARKTNDVMKILTIFSVFFMPLTFIVGVYGMNFKFMPELEYKWGYPLTLASMVLVSFIIWVWFRRKRWL